MIVYGARLLIEPEINKTTELGFEIPQDDQEKGQVGIVKEIGNTCVNKFSIGERILFDKGMMIELKADGKTFYFIEEIDVLGRL